MPGGSTCPTARQYMDEMRRLLAQVNDIHADKATEILHTAWRGDRRVFIFGNGGSAHTASHWALDLMKTAEVPGQPRLRAMSLTDHMGVMTAVGNDLSYDDVFRYPLSVFSEPGDVAVAISCSGNSPNAVKACEWAGQQGMTVITLTGFTGGALKKLGDVNFHVPNDNYGLIEDIHMSVGHIVAQGLRHRILAEIPAEEKAAW
ncbi:MAG: SIS domain-containing protein [Phycisphaeraceae bacterium]|nr:SIS domain-containing protein [Phycisphaeraceae bacterium]